MLVSVRAGLAFSIFGFRILRNHTARRDNPGRNANIPGMGEHNYPKSPKEMTKGLLYFPRMIDKIRMHLSEELHDDYVENFGAPQTADSALCNFLRIHHRDLIKRVEQGGSDEEILEWCFENGRHPNQGDIFVWNGFISKLGWRDRVTPRLEARKNEMGVADRDDIQCIPDLIDFDEGRIK